MYDIGLEFKQYNQESKQHNKTLQATLVTVTVIQIQNEIFTFPQLMILLSNYPLTEFHELRKSVSNARAKFVVKRQHFHYAMLAE